MQSCTRRQWILHSGYIHLEKLQEYENGKQLQGEFEKFVVHALNEKWERDFGELLRWKWVYTRGHMRYQWPKCDYDYLRLDYVVISEYLYCPHCGQRLLPPEEAQEK